MRRGRAPSRELSGSGGPQWDDPNGQLPGTGIPGDTVFFFCCIAELAIKPCRSSRSKLRGEFGIPNTCKTVKTT